MWSDEAEPVMTVSEFVEILNQTLEYAFATVVISGELANLRISRGKWLYFDLKDESSTVKFFGTVYQLPGPLEDGMLVRVRGVPKLHNLYGFSVTVQSIQPAGEGALLRAAELLQKKLSAEGLFDESRKRTLPYPPQRIGLITSKQSAAYADFVKILAARWGGVAVEFIDVQVQGEPAIAQVAAAIEQFNGSAQPPEVLVIIRGGGSAEDRAAFNSEQVTRAVAASRIPSLVAIGHEVDTCLAELAADRRASTPSNAAEMLVPDKVPIQREILLHRARLTGLVDAQLSRQHILLQESARSLHQMAHQAVRATQLSLETSRQLLEAYNPTAILRRGYAMLRQQNSIVTTGTVLKPDMMLEIEIVDAHVEALVKTIRYK